MTNNIEKLNTKWLGNTIKYYQVLDSTQTTAHALAKAGAEHGTIVIADTQTMGRGRLGRSWHSANDKGIWLSMIIRPTFTYTEASLITLYTSLAITKTLYKLFNIEAKVKWPNDVYINGKKCAGILTEVHGDRNKLDYLIIGIGINSDKTIYPEEIKDKAISLEQVIQYQPNKLEIIEELLIQFEEGYDSFISSGLASFYQEYNKLLLWKGEEIIVENINSSIKGTFLGIDSNGHLLIKDENEQINKIISGDISPLK